MPARIPLAADADGEPTERRRSPIRSRRSAPSRHGTKPSAAQPFLQVFERYMPPTPLVEF